MKKFILKVLLFIIITILIFILLLFQANGYTDEYYIRFTTPLQKNLILGTSKAAQALQPSVFKNEMDLDIYNYAFTIMHSSFGPVYLESIKRKLKPGTNDGIFIITVDPWSISSITPEPNSSEEFRENNLCLNNTSIVNMNPNFQYLIKNLKGEYYEIVLRTLGGKFHNLLSIHKPLFLHENGWLEVTANMDSLVLQERIKSARVGLREKDLQEYRYSSLRLEYLIKTIQFLKKHGKVYIVRLPIDSVIMEVENDLIPDFDDKMMKISNFSNGYFDMTPFNDYFIYVDGVHLHKESGEIASKMISDWIKKESVHEIP